MQLVGATRSFIRRPFLIRSMVHGIIAALVSILLLLVILYFIEEEFYLLFSLQDLGLLLGLFGGLIITGIIINYLSTYISVNKYLSISEDKLYI